MTSDGHNGWTDAEKSSTQKHKICQKEISALQKTSENLNLAQPKSILRMKDFSKVAISKTIECLTYYHWHGSWLEHVKERVLNVKSRQVTSTVWNDDSRRRTQKIKKYSVLQADLDPNCRQTPLRIFISTVSCGYSRNCNRKRRTFKKSPTGISVLVISYFSFMYLHSKLFHLQLYQTTYSVISKVHHTFMTEMIEISPQLQ